MGGIIPGVYLTATRSLVRAFCGGDIPAGRCWIICAFPPGAANGGIGAVILEKMLEREQGSIILGESEAPVHAPDPAMAERRLGFYARNRAECGVRYGDVWRTLQDALLGGCSVSDECLMEEHRFIYQSQFSPERYARYVRIPQGSAGGAAVQVPWDE